MSELNVAVILVPACEGTDDGFEQSETMERCYKAIEVGKALQGERCYCWFYTSGGMFNKGQTRPVGTRMKAVIEQELPGAVVKAGDAARDTHENVNEYEAMLRRDGLWQVERKIVVSERHHLQRFNALFWLRYRMMVELQPIARTVSAKRSRQEDLLLVGTVLDPWGKTWSRVLCARRSQLARA